MHGSRTIIYGVFKGMGDLLSALPVVLAELSSGANVVLLLYPQAVRLVDLIDFGAQRERLQIYQLPRLGSLWQFFRRMAQLSPEAIWISPHAPAPASSWKFPLVLWVMKQRYWPGAKLAGVDSERMSGLFDVSVPVDRRLPFAQREWEGYFGFRGGGAPASPPVVSFIESIQQHRLRAPIYDLLINPGAMAANRRWPLTYYPRLVEHIAPEFRIAVLGLPDDVEALRTMLPHNRGITYVTGSLEQAIAAIASSKVALTMDSGPAFFAKALGVPAIALFGASDPANVIGFDGSVQPAYLKKWPCQPCGNKVCSQKSVLCMEAHDPETIARELNRLLRLDRQPCSGLHRPPETEPKARQPSNK